MFSTVAPQHLLKLSRLNVRNLDLISTKKTSEISDTDSCFLVFLFYSISCLIAIRCLSGFKLCDISRFVL